MEFAELNRRNLSRPALILKRLVDILIGSFGCLFFLAAYPIVSLLIKLESPGPVLYKQVRVGTNRRNSERRQSRGKNLIPLKNLRKEKSERRKLNSAGVHFTLYKFRTMRQDAEKYGPQLCATNGDARITKVGKWLRYFHIDELPQFVNVLKGNMSLIGPRPERPFFTEKYCLEIPEYPNRTRNIKPGLTGLAQITLGYDESIKTVNRKFYYDITYGMSFYSFKAWAKMESWIFINTLKYLSNQITVAFKYKAANINNPEPAKEIDRAQIHVAHPKKMVHKIHKKHLTTSHLALHFPELYAMKQPAESGS